MTRMCGLHFAVTVMTLTKIMPCTLPKHVFTVAPSIGGFLNFRIIPFRNIEVCHAKL